MHVLFVDGPYKKTWIQVEDDRCNIYMKPKNVNDAEPIHYIVQKFYIDMDKWVFMATCRRMMNTSEIILRLMIDFCPDPIPSEVISDLMG